MKTKTSTRTIRYENKGWRYGRKKWLATPEQRRFFRALGAKGKEFRVKLRFALGVPLARWSGDDDWYSVRDHDDGFVSWTHAYSSLVICRSAWQELFGVYENLDEKTLGYVSVEVLPA